MTLLLFILFSLSLVTFIGAVIFLRFDWEWMRQHYNQERDNLERLHGCSRNYVEIWKEIEAIKVKLKKEDKPK